MWEKMIRQGLFQKRNEDKMNSKLRVRIIDMDSGWIINKFQNKLCEELVNLGLMQISVKNGMRVLILITIPSIIFRIQRE